MLKVNFVGVTGHISFDNTSRQWRSGQDVFLIKSARTVSTNKTTYERVGTWNSKRGLEVRHTLFLNGVRDFKNRTLIIAIKEVK
jgi:hypothetical protein